MNDKSLHAHFGRCCVWKIFYINYSHWPWLYYKCSVISMNFDSIFLRLPIWSINVIVSNNFNIIKNIVKNSCYFLTILLLCCAEKLSKMLFIRSNLMVSTNIGTRVLFYYKSSDRSKIYNRFCSYSPIETPS